ncbi:hypothetical protein [Solicola gregarius]|uniref:Uncharacterized protein n=1 Tax=Solicola gregarius TaxID=2908642 RepID=A0AA46TG31_9ACTN|nr:hypothetical protein [Solicola gregarius]UYM04446.1 hypothetical protein L0C25_18180 [Solicola gregarius]
MNLDDLRAELDARANDLDPRSTGRMAGIRAKIAQRRRRKAGATVAASVLAVGAIVGVPVVSHLSTAPEPANGGPFPEQVDGDTRIASVIGDEGDSTVTLEFTPDDTDFLLDIDCDDVDPGVARARVNGRWTSAICGSAASGVSSGEVGGVISPAKVRRLWERMGVRAGEPVTITVRAADLALKPTQSTKGTIGVAAYAMTGERRNVLGVSLPEEKTVDGETYALADDGYTVGPTRPKGTQRQYAPESDGAMLVTYGSPDRGALTRITIDGAQETTGGVSSELLPSGGARTLSVRNLSDDKWARLVVAAYTPVEDDEDTKPPTLSIPDTTDARDPLIASDVGEPGETVFRSTFTPKDANVAVGTACTLGGQDSDDVRVKMTMNGRHTLSGECQSFDGELDRGDSPESNRAAWGEFGIVAGEPVEVVIRARAKDGSDVSLDDIQLGFGVYERSAPRTSVNGFVLDDCRRWRGRWYKLVDYKSVDVDGDTREAAIRVPETGVNALVGHGYSGGNGGAIRAVIDGQPFMYARPNGSSDAAVGVDPIGRGTQDVAIRSGRNVHGGKLVIAYYLPEE